MRFATGDDRIMQIIDLEKQIDNLQDKLLTVHTILSAIDMTRVPEEVHLCLLTALETTA